MKLHEITPDDAYASQVRSMHRRELARIRSERMKRLRRVAFLPFVAGVAIAIWAITSYDDPNLQALKVIAAVVLCVPFLASFNLLGEQHGG